VADETLHRFFIWCGADLGLPIQFHVGYGDRDVDLHRCNPLLLTGLLRALEPTGAPVMLLHNYPYHREAGYLAQVFPHVYADLGLATHNVGSRAPQVLAEALEMVPLRKFLFSSDAYGLAEGRGSPATSPRGDRTPIGIRSPAARRRGIDEVPYQDPFRLTSCAVKVDTAASARESVVRNEAVFVLFSNRVLPSSTPGNSDRKRSW